MNQLQRLEFKFSIWRMARYLTCNLPGAVLYSGTGDLFTNLTDVRPATGKPGHVPQICDTHGQLLQ